MGLRVAFEVVFEEGPQATVGSEFDHHGAEIEEGEETKHPSEGEDSHSWCEDSCDHEPDDHEKSCDRNVAAHANHALPPFELAETFRAGL